MSEPSTPFRTFTDLLTGYRASQALLLAYRCGLLAQLGPGGKSAEELCTALGWDTAYGRRFLEALCGLGLLVGEDDGYDFAPAMQPLLASDGANRQWHTLEFEAQMFDSWRNLEDTLALGQRVFASGDKSPQELELARERYLGAMDEAARLRAIELWDVVGDLSAQGRLLDLGTGSGAYTRELLLRHPGWTVTCCDLPEVLARPQLHAALAPWQVQLTWIGCNLLEPWPPSLAASGPYDLVLLSNLIHCQGREETTALLGRAAVATALEGQVLIHDFFSDHGPHGALYDLHMMLNTYNGRTYTLRELEEMANGVGLVMGSRWRLRSGSTLVRMHPARSGRVSEE